MPHEWRVTDVAAAAGECITRLSSDELYDNFSEPI
jgi:hypothetical protein